MFPADPLKCPHKILEFQWLDDKFCIHYCIACGQKVSDNMPLDSDDVVVSSKFVSGEVKRLTLKERKELR